MNQAHTSSRGSIAVRAVLHGIVGALAGAFLGYRQVELEYRSEGLISINPYVAPSLLVTENVSVLPMFDDYVKTQIALIQDSRIRNMAMEDDRWRSLGRRLDPETGRAFEESLTVSRDPGGRIIRVSYTDPDPKAALAAVHAVIEAYDHTYGNNEAKEKARVISALETKKANLTVDLSGFRDKILEKAEEYASDKLDEVYAHKLREWLRLDTLLKTKQRALSASGIVADEFTQQEEQKEESRQVVRAELAVEQIARRDRGMRDLVAARGQLQTELDILRAQHLGDKHREVARLLITIPMLDKLIEEAAKRFNESWMAFGPDRAQIGRAADHANTFRQLAQEVRQLEAARNRAKRETVAVGGKNLAIKRLQEDVRRIEKQLAKTNARIKELTVESGGATSRINVVNLGDLPHFPINTGRRTRSTVLASAGGAASGVAVVLLFALLRRLLPHDDEAEERLLSATADPSICIVHLGRTQRIGRELGELLNPVDPTTLHIYRLPANTEVELHHHDMDEYWLFISGHPQVTRRSPAGEPQGYSLEPGDLVACVRGVEHTLCADHELVYYQFSSVLTGKERPGHLTGESLTLSAD